ncbi:MAG: hypothetical protein ABL930_07795 [Pseudobdellovibrio sp.]
MNLRLLFVLILTVLSTTNSWGQDLTTSIVNMNTSFDALNAHNRPSQLGCEPVEKVNLDGTKISTTTCALSTEILSKASVLILEYDSIDKVPDALKNEFSAAAILDAKKWSKVYVGIGFVNDNIQMVGLCPANTTACGDDVGFTTGSRLEMGGVYQNTYDIKGELLTNTYTQEVPGSAYRDDVGRRHAQQKFRNETILQIVASNQREGKLNYWNAKTGLVNISSKQNLGWLDGTRQQASFHEFLNKVKMGIATKYQNINDGQKDQWGAFWGAMLGLQKHIELGEGCSTRVYAAAGGQVSTLAQHSNLQAQVGLDLRYQLGRGEIRAGVSNTTTVHSAGRVNETELTAAFNSGRSVEVGVNYKITSGQLQNHVSYNSNNVVTGKPDKFVGIYIKYYLKP